MMQLANSHVSQLFMQSNIQSHQRDADVRLLDELLATLGLDSSDLVALSRDEYHLIVICASQIVVASAKGFLSKRVEVRDVLPFEQVDGLRTSDEGRKDKHDYILALASRGPSASLRLVWPGWLGDFGGTPAASAQAERDRVFRAVKEAIGT